MTDIDPQVKRLAELIRSADDQDEVLSRGYRLSAEELAHALIATGDVTVYEPPEPIPGATCYVNWAKCYVVHDKYCDEHSDGTVTRLSDGKVMPRDWRG